jgi:predicted PurR-regulated permease PerM
MGDENLGDVSQKTGSKKLLYGIVAVVIVVLIGVYFIFMSGGSSPEDEVVEKLQPIIDNFEEAANSIAENSDNPTLSANVFKTNITGIEQNGSNFEVSVRFYLNIQTPLANSLVFTYDGDEGKFTKVTSSGTLIPLPAEMTFEEFQAFVKKLG